MLSLCLLYINDVFLNANPDHGALHLCIHTSVNFCIDAAGSTNSHPQHDEHVAGVTTDPADKYYEITFIARHLWS